MKFTITTVEEAIDFLRTQGYQINLVDGIYRIRKKGWEKKPYEIDAESLIEQANLAKNIAGKKLPKKKSYEDGDYEKLANFIIGK